MKSFVHYLTLALLGAALLPLVAQAQGPTLDPTFAITTAVGALRPAEPSVYDMVRQSDGKIIVAGELTVFNGVPVNGVCQLLPNGQLDTSFTVPPIGGGVYDLAL